MPFIYQITDDFPGNTGFQHFSDKQKNNVDIIYNRFHPSMTNEALAGILGNMDAEGFLNPGQGELQQNMSPQYGLGLIQWTPNAHIGNNPLQVYAASVGGNWYDGDIQCDLILTGEPGAWITTSSYPYTWDQYCQLTDIEVATKAYFYERLRGTWLDTRLTYARDWLQYIGDIPPTPPGDLWLYGGIRDVLRRLIIHC